MNIPFPKGLALIFCFILFIAMVWIVGSIWKDQQVFNSTTTVNVGSGDLDAYALNATLGNYSLLVHWHNETYALITHNHTLEYAPLIHWHNTTYALINHDHDLIYAPLIHWHNSTYALLNHNHDSDYAELVHWHNSTYSLLSHTHTENNLLEGLSPTLADWELDPTNFANSLDNDITTTTTDGNVTNAGTGTYRYGNLTYDLGSIKHVTASIQFNGRTSTGSTNSINCYCIASIDGTNFYQHTYSFVNLASLTTTEKKAYSSIGFVGYLRYLKISFGCYFGSAGTTSVRLSEIDCFEVLE